MIGCMIGGILAGMMGVVVGYILRSDIERGRSGRWLNERRENREEREALDDMRVLQFLESNKGGATMETMLDHLPLGAGRLQGALERLEGDGILRAGDDPDRPGHLLYRRDTRDEVGAYRSVPPAEAAVDAYLDRLRAYRCPTCDQVADAVHMSGSTEAYCALCDNRFRVGARETEDEE